MDNIPVQIEQNPNTKNQKSCTYRVLKFFLALLLIPLWLTIKTFASGLDAGPEKINQIEEYAKQAVTTSYKFEEGVSYQAYVDEICELSTASYCEQMHDVISQEQYTKLLTVTIQCELLSSEYMDTYKTSGKTIFVYRIKSQLLFDGYEDILENDDAVIMTDENGWKMMNLMDYDEFVELINQD